jgi:hypothetical protein
VSPAAATTSVELASATFTAAEAPAEGEVAVAMTKFAFTFASEAAFASAEFSVESAIPAARSAVLVESTEAAIAPESVVVEPVEITVGVPPVEAAVKVVESMEPRAAAEAYPESRMHVIEAVPRAGADEYSLGEPLRPPVAVGGAIERIIRVITPGAYRRRIVEAVARTYLYADRNLGL